MFKAKRMQLLVASHLIAMSCGLVFCKFINSRTSLVCAKSERCGSINSSELASIDNACIQFAIKEKITSLSDSLSWRLSAIPFLDKDNNVIIVRYSVPRGGHGVRLNRDFIVKLEKLRVKVGRVDNEIGAIEDITSRWDYFNYRSNVYFNDPASGNIVSCTVNQPLDRKDFIIIPTQATGR